jgi:hypothetical protein
MLRHAGQVKDRSESTSRHTSDDRMAQRIRYGPGVLVLPDGPCRLAGVSHVDYQSAMVSE